MPKQKILDVSLELFSKGYYNSITLAEIADKAGIKKPSIYAHFASKENLVLEVLDRELSRAYEYMEKTLDSVQDKGVEIKLYNLLAKSIEYVRDNPASGGFWANMLFTVQKDLPEQVNKRIKGLKGCIKDKIFQIIKQGLSGGEVSSLEMDSMIYSYLCLLQGNLLMALNSEKFSMDRLNTCWSYFWEGVRRKN